MEQQTYVFDVTEVDFQNRVLARSREIPILLDLWAPWCGPCKTLTPILEALAAEYAGAFELAKVNVDECPQISMALRVQSVPTVYLIKDGQPVDGFQGAQPESAIRALLDRHVAKPALDPLDAAKTAMSEGRDNEAAQLFRGLIETDPPHAEARLGRARLALKNADATAAQGWLEGIQTEDPLYHQVELVRGVIAFSEDTGDMTELLQIANDVPTDAENWYRLGATHAVNGTFPDAMVAFLTVVTLDRSLRDDGGRKALLSIFDLVGADDPDVIKSRRALASLLF
ncbi:MAG: tetratricopeptide repeat protein [Myxococcota bacterium]|nr:tetratricopeptide repeat protein [Myxococcota bacterium]